VDERRWRRYDSGALRIFEFNEPQIHRPGARQCSQGEGGLNVPTPVVWQAGPVEAELVSGLLVDFRDWAGSGCPSADMFLRSVETLMQDSYTTFLLGASEDHRPPEGVCQLRFRLSVWTASEDCWLEDIFVRERARGTGLGRALLDAACAHARARGCRRIELDVNEDNDRAAALYRAVGFSPHSKGMSSTGRDVLMGMRLRDR
jgi:predicted GNAT family N-acyltransferase